LKPNAFNYVRAKSLDDIFSVFSEHGDEAKILAGGQSLIPTMNMRFAAPDVLIDVSDVDEMKGIQVIDNSLRIGAMSRHVDVLNSADVAEHSPLISAVKCGLDMAEATKGLDNGWEVRVGVHAGPVVAGIVGDEKYQFDVWGNTVNTAARMTGPGDPGKVVMTYDSWLQVQDECEGRSLGQVDVKGKGQVEIVECYGLQ
jgi:class 3 adenylate cyclase